MEETMGNTELLRVWRARIGDYRSSGLTMMQWCEKSGYTIGQLKYWITKCNKLARNAQVSGWARVEVVDSDRACTAGIMVRIGVARIELEPGFNRDVLADVMRVAASIC
jgi:hypothetical protein